MRIGVLDEKLGIMVVEGLEDLGYIQTKQIKMQMPEGATLNDLAFFYMPDRDWIVINKGHKLYDLYSQIIPCYLEMSVECRKKAHTAKLIDTVKNAFDILDDVIRQRFLIYGKEVI